MSDTLQGDGSTMSTKAIIDKFKDVGVDKVPTIVKRDMSTVEGRAEHIVDEHVKRMEDKTMCVIQELAPNEFGILSFKRSQFSKVWFEFAENRWKCDCESFRYGTYEKCKHILAIEIIKQRNISLPTIDDVMSELYNVEE